MNPIEYWEERAVNTLISAEMSVVDYFDSLERAYDITLLNIRKEINAFFEKYGQTIPKKTGKYVTMVEARKLLMGSELKDFRTELQNWYDLAQELGMTASYSEHLKKLAGKVRISRLEELEEQIRFQLEELAQRRIDGGNGLKEINYLAAYYGTYYTVSTGVNVGVKFGTLDANSVEKALQLRREGADFSTRIWGDTEKLVATLNRLLPQSFSAGLSSKQLGDMLSTEMNKSRGISKNLVRTEINFISNQATLDTYKAANLDEYLYLATLDMRTTEICRGLHMRPFKVTEAKVGLNYPPMHVNCRSTTIANVIDMEDEDFEIAARDEKGRTIHVRGDMTQEEWIKTYVPKSDQERLLRFLRRYKVPE